MSKKEETKKDTLKVLTINELIMGSLNEDIKDAIVTAYSKESEGYDFYDLETLHQLQDNGNKDLEFMKNDTGALACYIDDRRSLLVAAYQSFVTDQVIKLASCVATSTFNTLNVYVDFNEISYILRDAFAPHPLVYAYADIATENYNDLHIINHIIPQAVLMVGDYIRRAIYSSISSYSYRVPKEYCAEADHADEFIEGTQRQINICLTQIYCNIKEYVKVHSLPLGYPEYKLEQQEDGSLIPVLEEDNKDEK